MNKYLILLLIWSFSTLAAGGDSGTGSPNSSENNEYQLLCFNETNSNQEHYQRCIVVETQSEN